LQTLHVFLCVCIYLWKPPRHPHTHTFKHIETQRYIHTHTHCRLSTESPRQFLMSLNKVASAASGQTSATDKSTAAGKASSSVSTHATAKASGGSSSSADNIAARKQDTASVQTNNINQGQRLVLQASGAGR
jgi:hypothetical protein